MKKVSRILVSGVLAACTLSMAYTSTAITAGGVTLNESNFRAVANFDNLPCGYQIGSKPGYATDNVGLSIRRKFVQATNIGVDYNLSIVGNGATGKGLELDVTEAATDQGVWSPMAFHMEYLKGSSKVENVEGATDFMFWVDTTQFKDKSGNYESKMFVLTIQETDVLPNGKLGTGACAWKTKTAEMGGYYWKEKGNGWEKVKTCRDADNIPGMKVGDYVPLPKNYKGYIRIPIESLCHVTWSGNVDSDNKFDGKQIQYVAISGKNYLKDAGSKIIFDDIGFYGNFKTSSNSKPIASSSKNVVSSKAIGTNSTGSAAGSSTLTSSNISSSSASASSAETSSSESAASSAESAQASSGTQANTAPSSGNNVLFIVLIVIVVVAAAGVGAFFIVKKVRSK